MMRVPVLGIVQARMASKRLPGKMLLPLGSKPLIRWAIDAASFALGAENVVVAVCDNEANAPLIDYLKRERLNVDLVSGIEERNVLARLATVAAYNLWRPGSVVVRITPDDPFKDPRLIQEVAFGRRHPVEKSAEACTLGQLVGWHNRTKDWETREHVGKLFTPPWCYLGNADDIWTVDTPEDYERAKVRAAKIEAGI